MRHWINLVEGASDFLSHPFVKAWDECARSMGSDPVREDRIGGTWAGGYKWEGLEWHVCLRPYGTFPGEYPTVEISHIQAVPQGTGIGNRIMKALCALADEHDVHLILIADESNDAIGDDSADDEDYDGYDEQEHWLQTWYSSLGFDYTGDTGDYGPYMARSPR